MFPQQSMEQPHQQQQQVQSHQQADFNWQPTVNFWTNQQPQAAVLGLQPYM
jgi:hypothetical protein